MTVTKVLIILAAMTVPAALVWLARALADRRFQNDAGRQLRRMTRS